MPADISWDDEHLALDMAPHRKQQRKPKRRRKRPRVSGQLLRLSVPDEEDREEFCEALEEVLADMEGSTRRNGGPDPLTTHAAATKEWEGLQRSFLKANETRLLWELGWSAQLAPVYPESAVQKRFLGAGGAVLPAYHGTLRRNIGSICRQGLLLPGQHGVRVANGNAHGRGIYTARLGGATLSEAFCDSNEMFVCAVKDAAPGAGERPPPAWASVGQVVRGHQVLQKSGSVLHVGSAMVVRDADHVAPLFLAHVPSIGCEPSGPPTLPAHMVERMRRYWSMSAEERCVRRRQDQRARAKWMRRERSAAWEDDSCSCDSSTEVDWEDDCCSCDSYTEAAPQDTAAQASRAARHGRCGAPADPRHIHPFRLQLLPHLTGKPAAGRGRAVADAPCELDSLARLAGDIVSALRASPLKLVELASGRQHARRYNSLVHGGRRMNDGSFSRWLRAVPGVQMPDRLLTGTEVSWAHAEGARLDCCEPGSGTPRPP
mmetsp:Transcript_2584/g.7248  ORF Transcript_2584/g.7248 Transcript_2584/m.7248 type:complete len:489 (-) Transcript_2584:36-1502(-)